MHPYRSNEPGGSNVLPRIIEARGRPLAKMPSGEENRVANGLPPPHEFGSCANDFEHHGIRNLMQTLPGGEFWMASLLDTCWKYILEPSTSNHDRLRAMDAAEKLALLAELPQDLHEGEFDHVALAPLDQHRQVDNPWKAASAILFRDKSAAEPLSAEELRGAIYRAELPLLILSRQSPDSLARATALAACVQLHELDRQLTLRERAAAGQPTAVMAHEVPKKKAGIDLDNVTADNAIAVGRAVLADKHFLLFHRADCEIAETADAPNLAKLFKVLNELGEEGHRLIDEFEKRRHPDRASFYQGAAVIGATPPHLLAVPVEVAIKFGESLVRRDGPIDIHEPLPIFNPDRDDSEGPITGVDLLHSLEVAAAAGNESAAMLGMLISARSTT